MYKLYIKTKFNEINLIIDNITDEEVQEILNQPYVEFFKKEEYLQEEKNKAKKLTKINRYVR